jgi:hypothetical protein
MSTIPGEDPSMTTHVPATPSTPPEANNELLARIFGFNWFMTPAVPSILWAASLLFGTLVVLYGLVGTVTGNLGDVGILVIGAALLGIVWVRLSLEVIMVLFKICEHLAALRAP